MKKGITLVVLIITLVVAAIITVAVAINVTNYNVVENAQNAAYNAKRADLVENIAYTINTERTKKELTGEYLFSNSDLFTILETFGTFNHDSLYLTTNEDELGNVYDISLFEIYDVDVSDFISASISASNVLTITSSVGFDVNKYVVKYQIGIDEPIIYTSGVQLAVGDLVNVLLYDKSDRKLAIMSVSLVD